MFIKEMKEIKIVLKGAKMKTVGIIAEYNPFHNGHEYQLKKAKELTGAD